MNKRQQAAYDRTCARIYEELKSYHAIAVRTHALTDELVTGETIRLWFSERRIPVSYAFVLYELMGQSIDPLTLTPDLAKYVEMKAAPESG